MAFSAVFAAGFVDFALIAFHLSKTHILNDPFIPVLYSLAMLADGLAALLLGKMFDKSGLKTLVVATLLSAAATPLCFLGNYILVIPGLILWGIGMASQESVMRAVVTSLISSDRRATAHGMQNAIFGIAWFIGSVIMGMLYDISVVTLVIVSTGLQIISVFLLSFITSPENT